MPVMGIDTLRLVVCLDKGAPLSLEGIVGIVAVRKGVSWTRKDWNLIN